jgi:hypothetical protein
MVKDIILFAVLRGGGLRHYYQPWVKDLTKLLDTTYNDIEAEKDIERKQLLTIIAYEVGSLEVIPLILRQGGDIPKSWRKIVEAYSKLLKKR